MIDLTSSRRQGSRYWLLIFLIAIAVHLIVIFGVKNQYLNVFRKSIDDNIAASSAPASFPDAIVAVTVDVEGEEPVPVEIETPPREVKEPTRVEVEHPGDDPNSVDDILEVVGQNNAPMPSRPSTTRAVIPPRPVEITWPETKNLSHCLGTHVDVRIHVDEKGKILAAEPSSGQVPDECAAAALRAARRIVFLPGTVDGKPQTMWTEIRIDFRTQSR
ncbi:MAG: energy transducer TonB [Candidatus Latescibacterota bacterium]|jgi:TonB family protein